MEFIIRLMLPFENVFKNRCDHFTAQFYLTLYSSSNIYLHLEPFKIWFPFPIKSLQYRKKHLLPMWWNKSHREHHQPAWSWLQQLGSLSCKTVLLHRGSSVWAAGLSLSSSVGTMLVLIARKTHFYCLICTKTWSTLHYWNIAQVWKETQNSQFDFILQSIE